MERILKSKKRSELFTVKKDELENVCERIFGTIYLKKKKFINIKNSYYISFQYYFLTSVTQMLTLQLLVILDLSKLGQFPLGLPA